MIIAGIVLLLVGYLVPDLAPDAPPGLLHVAIVLGYILLIGGVILFLLGAAGRPVGGRKYWW